MLLPHTRARRAVVAGLRCRASAQSKAELQILQKVSSHPKVSSTADIMASLLFVGWLHTEECTSDGGGSLWLSQRISKTFYFLSCPLQFSPSFPSGLGSNSNHRYS